MKFLSGAVIGYVAGTRIGPETVIAKSGELLGLGRVRDRIGSARSAGSGGSRNYAGPQVDPLDAVDDDALHTALLAAGSVGQSSGPNGLSVVSRRHAALAVPSKARL